MLGYWVQCTWVITSSVTRVPLILKWVELSQRASGCLHIQVVLNVTRLCQDCVRDRSSFTLRSFRLMVQDRGDSPGPCGGEHQTLAGHSNAIKELMVQLKWGAGLSNYLVNLAFVQMIGSQIRKTLRLNWKLSHRDFHKGSSASDFSTASLSQVTK